MSREPNLGIRPQPLPAMLRVAAVLAVCGAALQPPVRLAAAAPRRALSPRLDTTPADPDRTQTAMTSCSVKRSSVEDAISAARKRSYEDGRQGCCQKAADYLATTAAPRPSASDEPSQPQDDEAGGGVPARWRRA